MGAAAACGIDPVRYWRTKDPMERMLLDRVAEETIKYQGRSREDLANRITNKIHKMLAPKQQGG